jgi:SAM-dependent methyltransferase
MFESDTNQEDQFHGYARMYDELIGKPSLEAFISKYLQHVTEELEISLNDKEILSIGCGTGLVEAYIINQFGIPRSQLYGMDISDAMVNEARHRIEADQGDILELDPNVRTWDFAYSGLNVMQYLPHQKLEEGIMKTAAILKQGGYFVGDFITPDHIRWYPNVMFSKDEKIISMRTPELIEKDGISFQESEIINLNFSDQTMQVNYAGKHRRYLPALHRIRGYFEKHFKGQVKLFDAVKLTPISENADTCPSTRYVVIAQKK